MNEIMAKAPKGFRACTDEEQRGLDGIRKSIALVRERIARYDAEAEAGQARIEAARAKKQLALLELEAASAEARRLNETLGLAEEKDLLALNGAFYVRENGRKPKPEGK